MNIQVQCCSMAILVLLAYFFFSHRMLGLRSETMFIRVMVISFLCLAFDIASIAAIVYRGYLPRLLVDFTAKTYLVTLIASGYNGLIYACMDMATRKKKQKIIWIYAGIALIGSLVIYILPIDYYHMGEIVYSKGPSCIATYLIAFVFILITFYQVLFKRQEINRKRRQAVTIWLIVWTVAALIQYLFPKILLVGFASVFAVIMLFFELENPESYLDRETGVYNAHSLWQFIRARYEKDERFCTLLISFAEYQDQEELREPISEVIKEIAAEQGQYREIRIFKNVEQELVLTMQDEQFVYEVIEEVKNLCRGIPPFFLILPDSLMLKSADEIYRLIQYYSSDKYNHTDNREVVIDVEKIEFIRERERTEKMILSAMENDSVEVFYQPIYAVEKKRFTSAEALVRIRQEDGKIVPPDKFIPIAEETGMIARLGEIVFEKTCRLIRDENLKNLGIEYIEVNLSVKQCEDSSFADKYIAILSRYDVEPSSVNLEITETASIQTRKLMLENMERLIERGVKFSLDDFGNGESNLNYIMDMPVSIVKLDKGMSQGYFENSKVKFVMEAALRMIQDMELEVVSEGIETKEQMEVISSLGIDYIQGYYFSRPIPKEEFVEFLRSHNL